MLDKNQQIIIGFQEKFNTDWWVEITTINPSCVYYFGPFSTYAEANDTYSGYVEDIDQEGAQGVVVVIKCCQPDVLTICDE